MTEHEPPPSVPEQQRAMQGDYVWNGQAWTYNGMIWNGRKWFTPDTRSWWQQNRWWLAGAIVAVVVLVAYVLVNPFNVTW